MRRWAWVLVLPLVLVLLVVGGGEQQEGDDDGEEAGSGGAAAGVPAEYEAMVARAGTVCPEVVGAPVIAAQIETESAWDPKAGSGAGAQGITQFMPDTWESEGLDGDGDGVADVWNPADAIWSQAHYMCKLAAAVQQAVDTGRLSGDVLDLALAAYNAGLGAVEAAGGVPVNGETEAYVPRIKEAAARYTAGSGGSSSSSGGGVGAAAVEAARGYLGTPYVWGGESAAGLDCSGLVMVAYRSAGVALPHSSRAQYGAGTQVPLNQARPGDLVFWGTGGSQESIYHVAIWVGEDTIIEAPTFGQVVRETPMREEGAMPWAVRPY